MWDRAAEEGHQTDAGGRPRRLRRGLIIKKYAFMPHSSKGTAFRALDHLYELGVLEQLGKGRSVRYGLCNRRG